MSRRALVLHHDANSTSGLVGRHLTALGWQLDDHFICATPHSATPTGPLPELAGCDLLVLTGSEWSVYDHATIGAWIDDELDMVRRADADGVAVFAMCFGGQALAAALGGSVERSPEMEIGWHTIESTEPSIDAGPWFQWHSDRFSAPPGAHVLAHSPAAIQAFRLRRNLGLQFHPELDPELLALWIGDDHGELRSIGVDPDALMAATHAEIERATGATQRLVDWFLAEVALDGTTPSPESPAHADL